MNITQLKQKTKERFSLSELILNHEQIEFDDVMGLNPKGITPTAIDMVLTKNPYNNNAMEQTGVMTWLENPNKFMFVNGVPLDMLKFWIECYEGDISALNADLSKGEMKILLSRKKSGTTGNYYKTFEVIEE